MATVTQCQILAPYHETALVYFISKIILRQIRNDWNLVWLLHPFYATVIRSLDTGIT